MAQVVKRYAQRRVVTSSALVDGAPACVETLRGRSRGDGVQHGYIERLNATFRERLAPLARRGRALARPTLTLQHGIYLVSTSTTFARPAGLRRAAPRLHRTYQTDTSMAAGITIIAGRCGTCFVSW